MYSDRLGELKEKKLAVVIELQGKMENQARSAWKDLEEQHNVTYISSRSPAPHITLESGFSAKYFYKEQLLRNISNQLDSFYIEGMGLGIFVAKTPVVHIRWQINECFLLLKQMLSTLLQSANEQKDISGFKMNLNWQAKTTLAFRDSSYENLYSILQTLQSNLFNDKMHINGLCLYEYSTEGGEQKISFFPFGV
jgi:2'-5' RNA ligase